MTFRDHVITDLCRYKKKVLNISEPGVYKYRGKEYKKDHILPSGESNRHLNILKPYRDTFYHDKTSNISFHRYFHHLNSSQALCINLFYPLLKEGNTDAVLKCLNMLQNIKEYAFEKESPLECTSRNKRKTSFDLFIHSDSNMDIYFEIKYTEEGFGKVKNDHEHRIKFEFTYEKLLKENRYIRNEFKNMDSFFSHYQILRNLIHLQNNSAVVFLFPQKNKRVNDQAKFARDRILNSLGRKYFHIIYLEEFVDCIEANIKTPNLITHYAQFREKYLKYCV